MSNMFKNLRKSIRSWAQLKDPAPGLSMGIPTTEVERHSENRNIELAKLRLQKEHYEKNLRIMIVTTAVGILGIIVSLMLGVVAITSRQEIKVEVHDQKTVQKSD